MATCPSLNNCLDFLGRESNLQSSDQGSDALTIRPSKLSTFFDSLVDSGGVDTGDLSPPCQLRFPQPSRVDDGAEVGQGPLCAPDLWGLPFQRFKSRLQQIAFNTKPWQGADYEPLADATIVHLAGLRVLHHLGI